MSLMEVMSLIKEEGGNKTRWGISPDEEFWPETAVTSESPSCFPYPITWKKVPEEKLGSHSMFSCPSNLRYWNAVLTRTLLLNVEIVDNHSRSYITALLSPTLTALCSWTWQQELTATHMDTEHFPLVASVSLEPVDQVCLCNRLESFNLKPRGRRF